MSLAFSDNANKAGIVELLDVRLKTDSNSYPLTEKVSDVNLAVSRADMLAIQAAGIWNVDDPNHTDHPIISTSLVSGQRDYSFTTDGSGSLILDIFKVFVADQNGLFQEVTLRDVQSETSTDPDTANGLTSASFGDIQGFSNGQNATGTPNQYDMTGNSIFLDPIPSYNYASGLKVYINRESTYFTTTDTTKKPGIAGLLHEYFVLRPALQYAQRNGLSIAGGVLKNGARTGLLGDVYDMEQQIITYYGSRERAGRKRLGMAAINFR